MNEIAFVHGGVNRQMIVVIHNHVMFQS